MYIYIDHYSQLSILNNYLEIEYFLKIISILKIEKQSISIEKCYE